MMDLFDAHLPERLAEALAGPLPGRAAQRTFESELAYGRHLGPSPAGARQAGVAILLYRRGQSWHLPLTLRPKSMKTHAGQISLPGGGIEPGETTQEAALRELHEELAVPPSAVRTLGRLSPLYVFASNVAVQPWVCAAVSEAPAFQPNADEVETLIELPLASLVHEAHHQVRTIRRGPLRFQAPCIQFQSHVIWGATAMILGELIAVCDAAAEFL